MSDRKKVASPREQRLVTAFVELADTLVDDYDVVDVLYRLSGHCVALLEVSASGLLLADQDGDLHVVATSNEQARLLELLQLQADEGPCLEAYRTGEVVLVDDLEAAVERWPVFVPEALADGFRSMQAVPLRLRRQVIGALNLFSENLGPMQPETLTLARALADTATIGILQERAVRQGAVLSEQLQSALTHRVTIEQAKGVISYAAGIPIDEAFEFLRSYSRNHNVRLSEIAVQLAQGTMVPAEILGDPGGYSSRSHSRRQHQRSH